MKDRYFSELDLSAIRNNIVFLDIDGTLVSDGRDDPAPAFRENVEHLKQQGNTVHVLSNKRLPERDRKLAEYLGVTAITSVFKKPSKNILESVPDQSRPMVVIGDKFLTDELFARNIRAEFIRVKRIVDGSEMLKVRLGNFIDDVVYWFYSRLK